MWDMPLGEGKISLVNQALNGQKATKEHGKVSCCVIKVYVCRVRGVKVQDENVWATKFALQASVRGQLLY